MWHSKIYRRGVFYLEVDALYVRNNLKMSNHLFLPYRITYQIRILMFALLKLKWSMPYTTLELIQCCYRTGLSRRLTSEWNSSPVGIWRVIWNVVFESAKHKKKKKQGPGTWSGKREASACFVEVRFKNQPHLIEITSCIITWSTQLHPSSNISSFCIASML